MAGVWFDSGMESERDGTASAGFARRCAMGTAIFLGFTALFLVLWYATYVLLLIFAGVLLAVLLTGLAGGLTRWTHLPDGWALTAVILALAAMLGTGVWLVYPSVSDQVGQLSDKLPAAWGHFKQQLAGHPWGKLLIERVSPVGGDGGRPAIAGMNPGNLLGQTMTVIVAAVVVGFTAIFLAVEPRMYTNGILLLTPRKRRKHAALVLQGIGHTLRWWLIGQGITMVVIGTLTGLGLWWIGVELWFLLGVLAGLFNFIPNFGPLVSFIPALLLALVNSPAKAGWVLVLYVCAQSFEGYVLTPLVQRRAVSLPPAVTITVQMLMGLLSGPLGVMLAAPLTAAGMVTVRMLYVEDVLGDEVTTPEEEAPVREGVADMTREVATREDRTTKEQRREGG